MTFKEAREGSREVNKRIRELQKTAKRTKRRWNRVRKKVCSKVTCSNCIGWNRCMWTSSKFLVSQEEPISAKDLINWAKGKEVVVK